MESTAELIKNQLTNIHSKSNVPCVLIVADVDAVENGWLISQADENPPNILVKKTMRDVKKELLSGINQIINNLQDCEVENFTIAIIATENQP